MCQQDFDFRLLSVGKMERRCDSDSTSSSRNSNGDDGGTYPSHCTSCSTTTTLTVANSLEDGSQGSEISGLDHQLPSMEKLKRSGCSNGTRRNTAGCLSCSRQRRDDYGGNDFGECHRHQHQLPPVRNTNSIRSQENEKEIMWRKERASLYTQFDSCASEIDTSTRRSSSGGTRPNCLLQSTTTTASASSSSSSMSMRNTGTGCAVDEKRFRQQVLYCGLSRAIWIQLGTLILLSLHLQGSNEGKSIESNRNFTTTTTTTHSRHQKMAFSSCLVSVLCWLMSYYTVPIPFEKTK
ncbi:unnamed protein product [Orchesella dallaii]|uniref:Uncharacterized protein n=1 Tax=Orchesella dallaii TaxID=48710 RepID=A0ABP1PYX6_9HEXA